MKAQLTVCEMRKTLRVGLVAEDDNDDTLLRILMEEYPQLVRTGKEDETAVVLVRATEKRTK